MNEAAALAVRFNACINAADLEGLAELMSADHRFIDTAGTAVSGKAACVAAWRGFFVAFPGYRNDFDTVTAQGNEVGIIGRSQCPGHPELEGPALWTATAAAGKVARWQVHEDTPAERRRLGLGERS